MQRVKKRKVRGRRREGVLMLALAVLLGVVIFITQQVNRPPDYNSLESPVTYGELAVHEADEVTGVSVDLPDGGGWQLARRAEGMVMADDEAFPLDQTLVTSVLEAARVVSYSAVLTDDPAKYADRLADFGLDAPTTAAFAYADGTAVTLRIGSRSDDADSVFYYMLIDGDDRLFALDLTTANTLNLERSLLHAVTQPTIHKARINGVTIELPGRTLAWTLNGDVQDADAADRWLLTQPVRYPADGERMAKLRENLANLRLGAYVDKADDLARYGFDAPRMTLTVSQGAGTVGLVDGEGVYNASDWPADVLTLTVGAAKNEYVDYVLYDGCVYTMSHYSVQTLMEMDERSTLTRYPVLTSLSNLAELTAQRQGSLHSWQVTYAYTEAADSEETELPIGAEEAEAAEPNVTLDGVPVGYAAFEAAYNRLLLSTVSGALPQGWQADDAPHTCYTFRTRTGVTHTIALIGFDALHDAVEVDGCAMFYIIRGGLDLAMPE